MKSNKTTNYIIIVLAILGMLASVYLSYLKFSGAQSSFCDISAEVSCSTVNNSIYSNIFGIPMSIMGFVFFGIILLLAIKNRRSSKYSSLIFYLTLFVLVPSLYLTYTEIFWLKSICIFCELSKALMLAILTLSYRSARREISWPTITAVLVVALIATGITYINQTGKTPTKNYDEFAQCLDEAGAKMYGAFWCANCAIQKQEFGNSFEFIEEIECDPRGENPQTERCVELDITKTPTWVIEKEGEVIDRLPGGYQKLEVLAEFYNCPLK